MNRLYFGDNLQWLSNRDEFPNENFRGKTVDYEVTLVALKEKRLPPLDDEFARAVAGTGPADLHPPSAESLREKVRANLRSEKEAGRRRKFRHDILGTILSKTAIPTPGFHRLMTMSPMMRAAVVTSSK